LARRHFDQTTAIAMTPREDPTICQPSAFTGGAARVSRGAATCAARVWHKRTHRRSRAVLRDHPAHRVLPAGAVFAVDHWEGGFIGNRTGSHARARGIGPAIAAGLHPGEPLTRVQHVVPGARILTHTEGVRRCKFLLSWLSELSRRCDPTTLPTSSLRPRTCASRGSSPSATSRGHRLSHVSPEH